MIIKEKYGDTDSQGKKWEDYDTILCPDGQIIDMQQVLHDQETAKAALVHMQPVFRGFINNLRPVYTFMVQTQATDGYNYFVNPQFTANLNLTEKTFVMAHEIMHCLLNHMRRGRSHDHMKSNIAADYECNITLVDMELFKFDTIKKMKAYIDKKYSGWGYEKIYNEVTNTASNNMNNQSQSSKAKNNQGKGSQQQSGGSSGGGGNQTYSADYKAGWAKAMADYKAGKLKL